MLCLVVYIGLGPSSYTRSSLVWLTTSVGSGIGGLRSLGVVLSSLLNGIRIVS